MPPKPIQPGRRTSSGQPSFMQPTGSSKSRRESSPAVNESTASSKPFSSPMSRSTGSMPSSPASRRSSLTTTPASPRRTQSVKTMSPAREPTREARPTRRQSSPAVTSPRSSVQREPSERRSSMPGRQTQQPRTQRTTSSSPSSPTRGKGSPRTSNTSPRRDPKAQSPRGSKQTPPTKQESPPPETASQPSPVEETPVVEEVPEPPREPTPPPADDPAEVAAMQEKVADKKKELENLEALLKAAQQQFKAENAKERAESLREKAAPLIAENKVMRKEITALRNLDRVLVNLRDQHETLRKHLRLKNANIRQKEATITIIKRRTDEQVEGSKVLLQDIHTLSTKVVEDAAILAHRNRLANSIDPTQCMAVLVYDDIQADAVQDKSRQEVAVREAENDELTFKLVQLQEELEVDTERIDGDVAAALTKIEKEWEQDKATMVQSLEKAKKETKDLLFHVRRGTNLKTSTQLHRHRAGQHQYLDVRELTLTLTEDQAESSSLHQGISEKRSRLHRVQDAHADHLESAESVLGGERNRVEGLRLRNAEIRDKLSRLRSSTGPQEDVDEALAAPPGGQPPALPPPKASSDLMQRLLRPTKAYQKHLEAEEEVRPYRQKAIDSVRRQRPAGVAV